MLQVFIRQPADKFKEKGFTLLEVIVAIAIVNIALVSLISLINFTLSASRVSVNRLIAANLAQEGIEAFRNDRDSKNNWDVWYSGIDSGDYRAEISTVNYKWTLVNNPTSYLLKYDDATGLYNHSDGVDTIFSRKINVENISPVEKKVVATITWSSQGRNYSLDVEHRLHNWKW